MLCDGLDATYAPSSLYIATPFFFNGTESTGSTHSNTTVDNVTTVANWAIGDWIQGTGIPADTRITNIVGTTLTLSQAATATCRRGAFVQLPAGGILINQSDSARTDNCRQGWRTVSGNSVRGHHRLRLGQVPNLVTVQAAEQPPPGCSSPGQHQITVGGGTHAFNWTAEVR